MFNFLQPHGPVTCQAPPSRGFSRQECWSGLPFPSPGDLLHAGIEPGSPALQAGSLPFEPPEKLVGEQRNYRFLLVLVCDVSVSIQSLSRVQLFTTLWTAAHQTPLSLDSPGKNTGVGCHSFLQGIFPIHGLNLCLLNCRKILHC